MSPAEELRAAATLLRDTASKATPGPWEIRDGNKTSSNVAAMDYHMVIDGGGWTDGKKTVVFGAALITDAAWIALMSPAVAEPRAAEFDALADLLAQTYSGSFREHDSGEQCTDTICRLIHNALASARLINGGAQ